MLSTVYVFTLLNRSIIGTIRPLCIYIYIMTRYLLNFRKVSIQMLSATKMLTTRSSWNHSCMPNRCLAWSINVLLKLNVYNISSHSCSTPFHKHTDRSHGSFWVWTTLHCNFVAHWLSTYTEWSLDLQLPGWIKKKQWAQCKHFVNLYFIVRRAGLLWSQQDFEWRWSVPLFKCLTVLEFSFILFDLCLLITFFNFIMNYVPIVTFWIFT